MSQQKLLEQAIAELRPIQFRYVVDGKVEGDRIGNPHIVYLSSKNDVLCDLWQTSGVSDTSEKMPGWRCFKVPDVEILELLSTAERFTPESTFNPSNPRFKQNIAKVGV